MAGLPKKRQVPIEQALIRQTFYCRMGSRRGWLRGQTVARRSDRARGQRRVGSSTSEGGLAIQVRPTWRVSRCGHCSRKASRYDRRLVRRWRHVASIASLYSTWLPTRLTKCGTASYASWRAEMALGERLAWASRSKLKPFVKAARTIRKHRVGILAYIRTRRTNGLVKGSMGRSE